ncbi:MAG: EF-hand domain-containing protein [Candidatus Omnitrophica bacterium]|nr:EF-hand domain-containing protein [Candidatus Omnitrophota bacterium]
MKEIFLPDLREEITMMSRNSSGMLLLVFMLVTASVAEAQMINYHRRNQRQSPKQAAKSDPQPIRKVKTEDRAINYYRSDYATEPAGQEASAQPRVTNRVERLYDLNRDGFLQPDEVADFYRDVVSSVQNRGSFRVSSDLLRDFDSDQDGRISRYEVGEIANRLN